MNVKTELSGESPERIIGKVQVIDLEPVRRWERIIGAWRRGSAQADGENYFLPASKTCIDSHDLRFVGDDVIARVEADVGDGQIEGTENGIAEPDADDVGLGWARSDSQRWHGRAEDTSERGRSGVERDGGFGAALG